MARSAAELTAQIKHAEMVMAVTKSPKTRALAEDKLAYLRGELVLQRELEARKQHTHDWLPAVESWGVTTRRCLSCDAVEPKA